MMATVLASLFLLQGATTPFTQQVSSHFAEWDKDGDGEISPKELDDCVADPSVTGEAAAAVAALKLMERGGKYNLGPITLALLDEYVKTKKDPQKKFPDLDVSYKRALRRIQQAGKDVFGEGAPRLDHVQQGSIGDCFFLSSLGAMVNSHPDKVKEMVTTGEDGVYTVAFRNGKTVKVTLPTDAELATSSSAGAGGRWVPLFEKAYATLRNGMQPEEKQAEEATDVISHGGSSGPCITALTGHKTKGLMLREKGKTDAPPPDALAEERAKKLRELLPGVLEAKRLVCAGTPKEVKVPGVNGGHVYSLLAFDPQADTVRIWNPHGNTFTPKGDPGLANGYPTKGGFFTLPLSDLVRVYGSVVWESE